MERSSQHLTTVEQWLHLHSSSTGVDPGVRDAAARMLEAVRAAGRGDDTAPFLTVVLQTRWARPEAFADALLTLHGQRSQNFELIVAAHDLSDDADEALSNVLAVQGEELRARTRVVRVRGGGRGRLLNEAVQLARGRMLAFLNEDDVLLGGWVEQFEAAAAEHPGKLIRVLTAEQDAQPEPWGDAKQGHRSTSWPNPEARDPFGHRLLRAHEGAGAQARVPQLAFPREVFTVWGLSFDDALGEWTEQELALRTEYLVGTHAVRALTSIHRVWNRQAAQSAEARGTAQGDADAEQAQAIAAFDDAPRMASAGLQRTVIDGVQAIRRENDLERRELQSLAALLHAKVEEMQGSLSWRITAPLRRILRFLRRG